MKCRRVGQRLGHVDVKVGQAVTERHGDSIAIIVIIVIIIETITLPAL